MPKIYCLKSLPNPPDLVLNPYTFFSRLWTIFAKIIEEKASKGTNEVLTC